MGVVMDDFISGWRRAALWRLIAALALGFTPALGLAESKVAFDVASDEFPKAILEFSHQSKLEVLFLADDSLNKIHTHAVIGELSPAEALRRLLDGTGLTYYFHTAHSVVVKQPSPSDEYVLFDIPAGRARDTLREWARQSGASVLFSASDVKGYRTRRVKGHYTRIDALLRMLADTRDLVARQTSSHTYQVDNVRPAAKSARRPPDMSEVLVAASMYKGLVTDIGEPHVTYDRSDFDASGAFSVADFAGSIPQVWGGGPNAYSQLGREGLTNSTSGTGFNFHSLGAESTLVLVDGIRPAGSGLEAGWWDVSLLPLSAIERVEIIPDGGSTRYGLDAISAVVNFVTRDIQGMETQVQAGGTTDGGGAERRASQLLGKRWGGRGDVSLVLEYYQRDPIVERGQATSNLEKWGGANFNSPFGYPGTLVAGGQTWAIAGTSNGKPILGAEGSSNSYDRWQSRDILMWQQRLSALGRGSLLLGNVRLWSSVWLSDRHVAGDIGPGGTSLISLPSMNPGYTDPLGGPGPVYVEYGFGNLLGPLTANVSTLSGNATAGMTFEGKDYHFELTGHIGLERDRVILGGYADPLAFEEALSDADSPLNPFAPASAAGPARLAGISHIDYYQSYSRLRSVDAEGSRSLWTSAAGNTTISIGAQYRQQTLSSFSPQLGTSQLWQTDERGTSSIYTNLELPLIGKQQAVPLVTRLGLSVGERFEHYSDVGTATSPALSLNWSPFSMVTLRGTYRQGFRPSALTERNTSRNISELLILADGKSALLEVGANPGLEAEKTKAWTAGIDLNPTGQTVFNATYYSVVSTDRVYQPTFTDIASSFNGPTIAKPTAAQRAAFCNEGQFISGTVATCEQTAVDLFIDDRLQSIEELVTSGLDLSARYVSDRWKLRLDGTYLLNYRGTGRDGIVLEELNTLNNPIDLRVRATAARAFGPITISTSFNYADKYWNNLSQPSRRIASWTTVDFAVTYRPVANMEFLIGARNLMNRQPPFTQDGPWASAWDPANGGNLEGRVISGQVRSNF